MLAKCCLCLLKLKTSLRKKSNKKWLTHIDNFCTANSAKYYWCDLFLDNEESLKQYENLPEHIERQIKNTNIASEITRIITDNYHSNDSNALKFCIELFSSYAKLKYYDVINPSQVTLNKFSADFQQFVCLMKDFIAIYYHLEEREIHGEDSFYRHGLPNLAVNLLFENDEFSSTVVKVVKSCYKESIDKISFHLQKYHNLGTEEFGISQKYLLNQTTLKHFNRPTSNLKYEKPYVGSVQIVKQIVKTVNPLQKLQLIDSLRKQIQSTIKQFYKLHSISSEISLSLHDLTAIILFIIVQSNQKNLAPHIYIINNFSLKDNSERIGKESLLAFNTCLSLLESGDLRQIQFSCSGKVLSDDDETESLETLPKQNYFDVVSSLEL